MIFFSHCTSASGFRTSGSLLVAWVSFKLLPHASLHLVTHFGEIEVFEVGSAAWGFLGTAIHCTPARRVCRWRFGTCGQDSYLQTADFPGRIRTKVSFRIRKPRQLSARNKQGFLKSKINMLLGKKKAQSIGCVVFQSLDHPATFQTPESTVLFQSLDDTVPFQSLDR